MGTTAALGLWVEALERHLRTLDAGDVIALAGESAHDLAVVLPSVGAAVGHRGSARTPRIRVLAALANLLAALSLRSTVVVVLDDVHLADGSSWEALHFLAGPQSLTRREREVISLAMSGLTAREIGEHLFIGERTVETHLANVYAKLGIGSRMGLLRIAQRLDL